MQPFFITKNQSTFGGQLAPKTGGQCGEKKGGQFARNFHPDQELLEYLDVLKNF